MHIFKTKYGRNFAPHRVYAIGLFVFVFVISAIYSEYSFQDRINKKRETTDVELSKIAKKLNGRLNYKLNTTKNFIRKIQSNPNINQDGFSAASAKLLARHHGIKGFIASPITGNKMVAPSQDAFLIGSVQTRYDLAFIANLKAAKNTEEIYVRGPFNIPRIGDERDIIFVHYPIILEASKGGDKWGLLTTVLNINTMMRGISETQADFRIDLGLEMRYQDNAAPWQTIDISDNISGGDPRFNVFNIANSQWRISATPRGGWYANEQSTVSRYMNVLGLSLLIFGTIYSLTRLYTQQKIGEREIHANQAQLNLVSTRLDLAMDVSKIGIWEFNMADNFTMWDERICEIYGVEYVPGANMHGVMDPRIHPDDRAKFAKDFDISRKNIDQLRSEFRVLGQDGNITHVRSIAAFYKDSDGNGKLVGLNLDITEDVQRNNDLSDAKEGLERQNKALIKAKSQVEYLAMHDPLTKLPNRRFLENIINELAQEQSDRDEISVIAIDLDRFKYVNDTLGHAAGDMLLKHVSLQLKKLVHKEDHVVRMGGDEFVIMCIADYTPLALQDLGDRIVNALCMPFKFEGNECYVGVSVGIATSKRNDADLDEMLINADLALSKAKEDGKGRYTLFTPALAQQSAELKIICDEITKGLANNEFIPFYQPQFRAGDHKLIGVETLVRWEHPERGILTPYHFLNAADMMGVTASIDHKMLEATLADLNYWSDNGIEMDNASVNISQKRLFDTELIDKLKQMNIVPGQLSFELVESIFLDDSSDIVVENIKSVKEMGIGIELDDFGTGHTSLISLTKISPRKMKLDRQLVIPTLEDPTSQQIIRSIVEIGKSLGIEVLAEGVETMEHAVLMHKLGCDALQGFGLARPMPADDIVSFVNNDVQKRAV